MPAKTVLRIYSHILQLRTGAFLALKVSNRGIDFAAAMFVVAALIAGSGMWFGLPTLMRKPLLSETVGSAEAFFQRFDTDGVDRFEESLGVVSSQSLTEAQLSALQRELPRIAAAMGQLTFSGAPLQDIASSMASDPDMLAQLVLPLGLSEEQIEDVVSFLHDVNENATSFLSQVQASIERFQPPIGVRPSRFIRGFGEWLSVPFDFMAKWALFGLALLIAVKLLGGTGTLRQHITGTLLSGAPIVLLLVSFVPVITPPFSVSYTIAFDLLGRMLAVICVVWSSLILLKSMSIMHEISMWRVAGAVALSWCIVFLGLPIVTGTAAWYVLHG